MFLEYAEIDITAGNKHSE